MKYITATTEKRILKAARKDIFGFWSDDEAGTIAMILDEIKSRYGWYGCSVSEARKLGQQFDNYDQIGNVSSRSRILYGWTVRFPELVNYTNTLGLDCLTIYDFNGLTRAVLED